MKLIHVINNVTVIKIDQGYDQYVDFKYSKEEEIPNCYNPKSLQIHYCYKDIKVGDVGKLKYYFSLNWGVWVFEKG